MADKPEDDEVNLNAEELLKIADEISKLMGGDARGYALKQLGNGLYSMVFDDSLEGGVIESADLLTYPTGAMVLNCFDELESQAIH